MRTRPTIEGVWLMEKARVHHDMTYATKVVTNFLFWPMRMQIVPWHLPEGHQ
jgi:hypothetical protein